MATGNEKNGLNKSVEVKLEDAHKTFTMDQDKIFSPEETVKRFKEKLKQIDLDIFEQATRIDNGRLDIPVYFSICGKDALALTGTKKQMGKGASPQQAEASAVMELAERFSFFAFCNDAGNFFYEKPKNIKDMAISFEAIAKSVQDTAQNLDVERHIYENLTLKWTRAYNLTKKEELLIPFDWFYMINEFNGPSAGNCVEEAVCQGICEIVERHVCSVISREKISPALINTDSATNPMVKEMLAKYEKNGIKLYLSDFSLDMGIPTIGALAYDPQTFPDASEIVWTAGTTPNPEKALSRALTEVAQLAGDFNTSANYVASGLPKFRTIKETKFITNSQSTIDLLGLPDISHDNIRIEVENCVAALAQKGLDVILINTMHDKLQIPAFYTIVPGAHFRERAVNTSVGMFATKLITEKEPPLKALLKLTEIEKKLRDKYYIHFYQGTCRLALDNPQEAFLCLNRALALNPPKQDLVSIYSYRGLCLKDMGEYKKALVELEKGEALDKDRTDIYNLMGFCYFMLKENQKAIDCFKKVLALNPSSAIDYANIASNYRDMGKTEKAIKYYELALALDDSLQFAKDNLSRLKNTVQ